MQFPICNVWEDIWARLKKAAKRLKTKLLARSTLFVRQVKGHWMAYTKKKDQDMKRSCYFCSILYAAVTKRAFGRPHCTTFTKICCRRGLEVKQTGVLEYGMRSVLNLYIEKDKPETRENSSTKTIQSLINENHQSGPLSCKVFLHAANKVNEKTKSGD